MSGKTSFILGYHDHLPAGSKDGEFEEIYSSRLKPLVTLLNSCPRIPAALHLSGPLLERLKQKRPEFFLLIGDLVARKQIELLGGGFYEPLLPLLPLADKIGQVELLTTYIRQHFGKKPQGCYLPFGAWEQSLTGVLSSCGMAYTFLGEDQFRASGIEGDEIHSPWITEDQGKLITVFPVANSLEDAVLPASSSFAGSETDGPLVTVFPRFSGNGAENSIIRFFEKLTGRIEEKKLELTLPGKVIKSFGPLKRAYFPSSADSEFMSLVADGRKRSCLQPRRFLVSCPEANNLYSKMYFTHTLINQLRGDKARKKAAREELWKAQGTDTFCRTGGTDITCSSVRKHAYKALITAERITRENRNFTPSLLTFDFDLDGEAEYLFQDKNINCYVKARGASVFELDYLPKGWNYLDTFSLHGKFRRCAFMDRILGSGISTATLEALACGTAAGNAGRFCGTELYTAAVDRQHGKVLFRLPARDAALPAREAALPARDAALPAREAAREKPFGHIEVEKSYQLEKNVIILSYTLTNNGETETDFCFTSQFDLSFADPGHFFIYPVSAAADPGGGDGPASGGLSLSKTEASAKGINAVEALDTKNNSIITFSSEEPFDLYLFRNPAPDASGDASGDSPGTAAYQSSCFVPLFRPAIAPGKSWSTVLRLSVSLAKSSQKKP
ncbi:MAG: DUF1926 domain-containing protein [Treponema sp.]|jgi:hypothetical protein|nr:DUF1926 domain-containing protein [Treponema sp.]